MAKAALSPTRESQTSGGSTNTPLNSNHLWEAFQRIEKTPAARRFGEFTLWYAEQNGRGASRGAATGGGGSTTTTTGVTPIPGQGTTGRTRRRMSAAGRKRIAEAQRRRWEAKKAQEEAQAQPEQAEPATAKAPKRKAPKRAKEMAASANPGE